MIRVTRSAQRQKCCQLHLICLLALVATILCLPGMLHAGPEVGNRVELEFIAVEGTKVDRDYLDGQVVIVHFWASWYNPSLEDLPTLLDLQGRYGHKGLSVIGISLDTDSLDRDLAIDKHGLAWPHFCDRQGWDSEMVQAWGISSIPMAFILTPEGEIAWRGDPGEIRAPFQKVWRNVLAQDEAEAPTPQIQPHTAVFEPQDDMPSASDSSDAAFEPSDDSGSAATSSTPDAQADQPETGTPVEDAANPQEQRVNRLAEEARRRIAEEAERRRQAVQTLQIARQALDDGDAAAMLDMIDGIEQSAIGDTRVVAAAKELAQVLAAQVRRSTEVQDILMKRPASVDRLQILINPDRARPPEDEGAIGESDGTGMHPILADEKYRKAEKLRDQERHYEASLLYEQLAERAAHLEAGIEAQTRVAMYRSRPALIKAVAEGKREYEARQALANAEQYVGNGQFSEARDAYLAVIETFEDTVSARQANAALKALP